MTNWCLAQVLFEPTCRRERDISHLILLGIEQQQQVLFPSVPKGYHIEIEWHLSF